ncbi:MAG: endonuclease domain-containing protein [Beijerinckiaceae bacterium]
MAWQQETDRALETLAAKRNAKALRKSMTEPEKKLWWHLRYRLSNEGSHFRRQFAIGPYVADFCCLAARLIVEVDGEQHGLEHKRQLDDERDAYVMKQNFRVLRFSNREVMTEMTVVLDTILAHLSANNSNPVSGPQREGKKETFHVQQL